MYQGISLYKKKNKVERLKAVGLLHPLEIPNNKWESISIDFIVSLPHTQKGHDTIWVVVDRLTKMARFIATKTMVTTPKLAYQFVDGAISFLWVMDIVSDRHLNFTDDIWTQVYKKLETTLSMSSTANPQSDVQTKGVNQIIEDMFRAYVGAKTTKWERYLPILVFAYNNSKHTSSGYSHLMLMYGFQPHTPIDVNIHHDELQSSQTFLGNMQDMLYISQDNIKTVEDRTHCYAYHNRQSHVFKPGQKVFLHVPHNSKTLSTGKCSKLALRFCGTFIVLKLIGSSASLVLMASKSIQFCYVSHLKELLGSSDNTITTKTLVTSEELSSKAHVPETILDVKKKHLCSKII